MEHLLHPSTWDIGAWVMVFAAGISILGLICMAIAEIRPQPPLGHFTTNGEERYTADAVEGEDDMEYRRRHN